MGRDSSERLNNSENTKSPQVFRMSTEDSKAPASSEASAVEHSDDDATKVFVSRLPLQWTDAHLKDHFAALFGPVTKATVRTDLTTGSSRGFGFVVFEKESSQQAALAQKSFHVAHKTVMIRPLVRNDNDASNASEGAATVPQVCFSWSEGRCTRGDACKFEHSGPGACLETAAPGQGKPNKCRVFRRKGACPAGDSCPFRHVLPSSASSKQASTELSTDDWGVKSGSDAAAASVGAVTEKAVPLRKEKGICNTWRKKGKCRKGDKCPFGHPVKTTPEGSLEGAFANDGSSNSNGGGGGGGVGSSQVKRRRIDGNTLVLAKKAMKRAQEQTGALEGDEGALLFLNE